MLQERAQLFTLEGLLAGLVVLASIVFVLQAVVVLPSSTGEEQNTANPKVLSDLLADTEESGALKRDLLSGDGDGFDTDGSGYSSLAAYPDTAFAESLRAVVGPTASVNVLVSFPDGGAIQTERLVFSGEPGDGAVSATATVAVYDSDELPAAHPSGPGTTVKTARSNGNFYAPDVNTSPPAAGTFTMFEVEVVVW